MKFEAKLLILEKLLKRPISQVQTQVNDEVVTKPLKISKDSRKTEQNQINQHKITVFLQSKSGTT